MAGLGGRSGRALIALAVLVALCGCEPSTDPREAAYADYLTRLNRSLDGDIVEPRRDDLPPYPPHRDLVVPIERGSIDFPEFFELHDCDLGDLVGFRNSPLGRMQVASQRLGYEAAWIRAAGRCPERPGWIDALVDVKRAQLPDLFWNATFAAPEMQELMGAAQIAAVASAPGADPAAGTSAGMSALAFVLRELSDNLTGLEQDRFDLHAFESTLSALRSAARVGAVRRDWAALRAHLGAAAELLERERARVCRNGAPTPLSRVLRNLFLKFYVEAIQAPAAQRLRVQAVWVRQLAELVARLPAAQRGPFAAWYAGSLDPADADSEWSRTHAAILEHARAWQRLFAGCGLEPAPPLRQH
ncbi:MAG: DUF3080 family protein [Pseudomonadales bacterium]